MYGEVERLVVVVEVDPAGLTGDVVTPLVGELEHARTAGVVELVDAERGDRRMARDAELLFDLDLRGQAVAVPSEPTLDPPSLHRLVARHRVLDEAGQQVAVVRQSVGERRAVVEHELVVAVRPGVTLLDRALERRLLAPDREDVVFQGGKVRLRVDGGIRHATMLSTRLAAADGGSRSGSAGRPVSWSGQRWSRRRRS